MNCRKYLRQAVSSIAVVVGAFFFLTAYTSSASAIYTSVTLSPATGTIYGSNTAIAVYANSGTDEFVGVDINIAFTGSVDYISATGAARCSSFNVTEGTGTVNVECLSLNHATGETYNGLVGTLYFKATATGTSVFTMSSVDPEATTKTGGTYTLLTSANTSGSGLPDSGLFDDSVIRILAGIGLLAIGVFINTMPLNKFDFLGRFNKAKQERGERKLEKNREKWENKF